MIYSCFTTGCHKALCILYPLKGFHLMPGHHLQLHSGPRCRGNEFMLIHSWAEASCQSGFHWKYVFRGTCSRRWSAQSNTGWVRDCTNITLRRANKHRWKSSINSEVWKFKWLHILEELWFWVPMPVCTALIQLNPAHKHLGKQYASSSHIVSRQLDVRERGETEKQFFHRDVQTEECPPAGTRVPDLRSFLLFVQ